MRGEAERFDDIFGGHVGTVVQRQCQCLSVVIVVVIVIVAVVVVDRAKTQVVRVVECSRECAAEPPGPTTTTTTTITIATTRRG